MTKHNNIEDAVKIAKEYSKALKTAVEVRQIGACEFIAEVFGSTDKGQLVGIYRYGCSVPA